MDKRGEAKYVRLPLKLEDEIERLADNEGRSQNDMMVYLLALGVHVFRFRFRDYTNGSKSGQGD